MGEHLPVVGELQLAADEAVGELPGLDAERADVARHLVLIGRLGVGVGRAAEEDLEHALPFVVGRAADQGDEVRGDGDRRGRRAAIENIAPVRSMRVDGPGACRSSKFSTNNADTMCMDAEGIQDGDS